MQSPPISPTSETGLFIQRMGYAGLIPFVLFAFLLWIGISEDAHHYVTLAMSRYGACLIAFLGGIHWCIGLQHDNARRKFHILWGVATFIFAWIDAMMVPYAALPLLGLLLIACYLVDRKTWPEAGLREWMTLRFRLTLIATLACVLGAAAT
jgi:hypothetical protein